MTKYFTQDEEGKYSEIDSEALFRDRHERWVKTESAKIREEVEGKTRDDLTKTLTESLTQELGEKVKAEYEPKLKEANDNLAKVQTTLRQKTIAAEYGMKAGTEKYLGSGTDEEMRKEAELIKQSFGQAPKSPDKETGSGKSSIQEKTGVKVTI